MPVSRPWARGLYGLVLVSTACSQADGPGPVLADYLTRIQYVMEWTGTDPEAYESTVLSYPRRRVMRLEQEDVRIGLLDFMALNKCGLQALVGQRNSGLGKVMEPSQRLVYEHRLLKGMRHCQTMLQDGRLDDAELLVQLDALVAVKEQDLPRAWWNATYGGPEFEALFSRAAGPLPLTGVDLAESRAALQYLGALGPRLGTTELELEEAALEARLFTLQAGRDGGRLLHSMDLLRFYLDGVAQTIEGRLAQRPICFKGQTSPKGRIMRTVFTKFYAGRIQPYMAQIHRQGKGWFEAHETLLGGQGLVPPAFAQFYAKQVDTRAPEGYWQRFERAIQRHTAAWQALMDQCGMQPGVL